MNSADDGDMQTVEIGEEVQLMPPPGGDNTPAKDKSNDSATGGPATGLTQTMSKMKIQRILDDEDQEDGSLAQVITKTEKPLIMFQNLSQTDQ